MVHVDQNKGITIHQLMNIVPLIQEKWSLIGTELKLSSDKLDDICQAASEQQIPAESKNTFCCVKMLTSWYETSDDVSVDAIMMAVDPLHVGLNMTEITNIEAALRSENTALDSSTERSVGTSPEQLEQLYFDMITKFCLELSKSQCSIPNILTYLKVCNINSDIVEEIHDFPELVVSFEKYGLLKKSDVTLLNKVAHHAQCAKAVEVVEKYETYIVGGIDKKPENVTIKDSSNINLAASRIIVNEEIDSIQDSTEVGSGMCVCCVCVACVLCPHPV